MTSVKFPSQKMSSVYLVTLSRADRTHLTSKKEFGSLVQGAFERIHGPGSVLYWCCSQEQHSDGEGFHYHCSVKLKMTWAFNPARAVLAEEGIHVHFAVDAERTGYHQAYSYITKEDPNVCYHFIGTPAGRNLLFTLIFTIFL